MPFCARGLHRQRENRERDRGAFARRVSQKVEWAPVRARVGVARTESRRGWMAGRRRLAAGRVAASWWRCSLSRLWVAVSSRHFDLTADLPRRRNRLTPRLDFIWPKTGSTMPWRPGRAPCPSRSPGRGGRGRNYRRGRGRDRLRRGVAAARHVAAQRGGVRVRLAQRLVCEESRLGEIRAAVGVLAPA